MAGITFSEASNINDSIFGKSQAPIRMFLEKRAEQFERESVLKSLFYMGKSNKYAEKFTSLTAMEGFKPVGENGSHPIDGYREGRSKTIEHMTWKDSFSISREMADDSNLLNLRQRPQAFITAYHRGRENFGAQFIGESIQGNSSFSVGGFSFDTTGADGKPLFATDHGALISGGDQCNMWSDGVSADAIGMMEVAMQNTVDDNGNLLDVAPDTILIPNIHSLKKAVFAAIGADKDPDTANNAFNYQFGRWNIIVWSYLNRYISSGTTPWIMLDSRYNQDYVGLAWLERVPLEVKSAIDEDTDANVWRGYARWGVGLNDWRGWAVGGVASGNALS